VASCPLALLYMSRLEIWAPELSREDLTSQSVCKIRPDTARDTLDRDQASKDCITEANRLMNPPK
jgi:hypothetical protein